MDLNDISTKLQQFAVFLGNVTKSCVQILIWATVAAVALAAVAVAFRVIWHAAQLVLSALGI